MITSGSARTTYLLHQQFRYDYSAPVHGLEHRLMVTPPLAHGDQHRLLHRLDVAGAATRVVTRRDRFGNHVVDVRATVVPRVIEFEAWVTVVRDADGSPTFLPAGAHRDARFLRPSPLTLADAALVEVAHELARGMDDGFELADRINSWVFATMSYGFDSTTVRTTAAQALTLRRGVCQDYAHVMLAVARSCGLAARYVSGHMVGEGGSHAWVEVILPDPRGSGRTVAVPFDPTHGRRAHLGYLTVATGRDYTDVAPTSGTFHSVPATQAGPSAKAPQQAGPSVKAPQQAGPSAKAPQQAGHSAGATPAGQSHARGRLTCSKRLDVTTEQPHLALAYG